MNILYMNQGGGGEWGVIKYNDYDLILLAENGEKIDNFDIIWQSKCTPVMTIYEKIKKSSDEEKKHNTRTVCAPIDLDKTAKSVRPILLFTLPGWSFQVVFVHLKSGNIGKASDEIDVAVKAVLDQTQFKQSLPPILWIGDFNRAEHDSLIDIKNRVGAQLLFAGGGIAKWHLDRAYTSGKWSNMKLEVNSPSTSSDQLHKAISVAITSTN